MAMRSCYLNYNCSMPPQQNTPTPPAYTPPVSPFVAPPPRRKKWPFIVGGVVLLPIAVVFVLSQGGPPASDNEPVTTDTTTVTNVNHGDFSNPELVTIEGYDGPAQDPTLSPDGTILLFDSHTDDPKIPVKLYWAKKTDYKTFTFMGEIKGVNQAGEQTLTATMDRDQYLYFTTTRFSPPFPTIARGVFTNGTVTQVVSVRKSKKAPPVASLRPGDILDLANAGGITQDGDTLYVSDLQYKISNKGQPTPMTGTLSVETKNSGGTFTKASNSDSLLKNVNGLVKIVYTGIESADGLELFFTGSDDPTAGGDHIRLYVARRSSVSEPFGTPEEITTPWKLVEAPYPSPDGTHLYFHR